MNETTINITTVGLDGIVVIDILAITKYKLTYMLAY